MFFSFFITGFINYAVSADSNSYYVSTIGSDSNSGSFEHPFKTIQKAVDVSSNGDTIFVRAGTYLPIGGQITIYNKNSANSWLTITNYQNDEVIVDGSNCPTSGGNTYWDGTIEIYNSKYIRISNIDVYHSRRGGITIYDGGTDCSYIMVDNCSITSCSVWGIKAAGGGNHITVENNYMYNNGNDWSGYQCGQEIISFEGVTDFSINNNTLINNCLVNIDCKNGCKRGDIAYNIINTTGGYAKEADTGLGYWGGQGIYIDAAGSSTTQKISIYNNLIYGDNSGISIGNEGSGCFEYIYIYNNILDVTGGSSYWNGRNPLVFHNNGGSSQVHNHVYVYSNTIVTKSDNAYSLLYIGDFTSSTADEWYIANNIFYTGYTGTIYFINLPSIYSTDGVVTLSNNLFYRPSGAIYISWHGTSYSSGSHPEKFGSGPIFTDPQFVNKNNNDFHLTESSPCIDASNSIFVPNIDFDGVSRLQGSSCDIGAFEFVSAYDNTLPQISYVSIETSGPLDTNLNFGWENISCTVTDNIGVDKVYIKIIRPNNNQINIEMTNIENSNYYYFNSSWLNYGNYSYIIRAIDTSGNNKYSNNFYFSLPPNWDINNDGRCSVLDLIMLSNCYNEIGSSGWTREDVDNNGKINLLDMSLVSNHYNEIWYT